MLTFEQFTDALYAAGWRNDCDAQHTEVVSVYDAMVCESRKVEQIQSLTTKLEDAEKERDKWKLRAEEMLREDSRFAVIKEQEAEITEQAAQIEALTSERDKLILSVADHVTVRAEQLQKIETLKKVLFDVRESLQFANDTPNGPIQDTIWMMHGPETLFDYIDAAIEKEKS